MKNSETSVWTGGINSSPSRSTRMTQRMSEPRTEAEGAPRLTTLVVSPQLLLDGSATCSRYSESMQFLEPRGREADRSTGRDDVSESTIGVLP